MSKDPYLISLHFILRVPFSTPWKSETTKEFVKTMTVSSADDRANLKINDKIEFDFCGGGAGTKWPKEAVVIHYKDVTIDQDRNNTFEVYLEAVE